MWTTVAQAAAAAVFGALARRLRTRPLHPAGAAFEAELVVGGPALPGVPLLERAARRPAFVRFSRGFGLPEPLPEILSMAIKVPDGGTGAPQDVLLTATGERPVLRHAFAMGRSHVACTYSSVFAFRAGHERVLLGARPRPGRRMPAAGDLGELDALARAGDLAFDLRVAAPRGPWRTVARLEIGRRLDPREERDLRFNTDNAGGGIEPVGFVNAVRGAAYAAANRNRP